MGGETSVGRPPRRGWDEQRNATTARGETRAGWAAKRCCQRQGFGSSAGSAGWARVHIRTSRRQTGQHRLAGRNPLRKTVWLSWPTSGQSSGRIAPAAISGSRIARGPRSRTHRVIQPETPAVRESPVIDARVLPDDVFEALIRSRRHAACAAGLSTPLPSANHGRRLQPAFMGGHGPVPKDVGVASGGGPAPQPGPSARHPRFPTPSPVSRLATVLGPGIRSLNRPSRANHRKLLDPKTDSKRDHTRCSRPVQPILVHGSKIPAGG
jgi:hypothetical protein